MKGQFDPKAPIVNTDGIEVEHPPFLSQAKVGFMFYLTLMMKYGLS